jgi:hypothetical protein
VQDPAFLAYVKATGTAAEKDMAQMQVPQSEIAAKSAATFIASTQMMAFMPKLMRGQRLIEVATVGKCDWATGVGVPSKPNG